VNAPDLVFAIRLHGESMKPVIVLVAAAVISVAIVYSAMIGKLRHAVRWLLSSNDGGFDLHKAQQAKQYKGHLFQDALREVEDSKMRLKAVRCSLDGISLEAD
jgi:hypothetical protein